MKKEEVPQDASSTYGGQTKLVYAVDQDGNYVGVPTTGWDVEAFATRGAVEDFEQRAADALSRAQAGRAAPLEAHMYARRMDMDTLCAATGYPRWRIQRHLRPEIFARLPDRKIAPYAEALGLEIAVLRRLPE